MQAYLSDENGINTAGTGIGHDITAVLDDDYSNVLVLNNYYQADINNYKSGVVKFPFKNLTPGKHRLTLKAWDIAKCMKRPTLEKVKLNYTLAKVFFMMNRYQESVYLYEEVISETSKDL